MKDLRLEATVFIWAAVAAILIFAAAPGDVIPLAFILGIGATISTVAIWETSSKTAIALSAQSQDDRSIIKNKRSDHTRRLVELMDSEEIDDLEAYLAARQDEQRTVNR
ncbi:MAG: hypothetical protein K8L99_12360 [Anaerolineae bacterium]|nr:hypothetical protein [Anaerolineae bacterium]